MYTPRLPTSIMTALGRLTSMVRRPSALDVEESRLQDTRAAAQQVVGTEQFAVVTAASLDLWRARQMVKELKKSLEWAMAGKERIFHTDPRDCPNIGPKHSGCEKFRRALALLGDNS